MIDFPNNCRNILETAKLCASYTEKLREILINIESNEILLNDWNSGEAVIFQFQYFNLFLLRKVTLDSKATISLDSKTNKINIYINSWAFRDLRSVDDWKSLVSEMFNEGSFKISVIHEICHFLQIFYYGESFFIKDTGFDYLDRFVELEAYTEQAINLTGNFSITFENLMKFVMSDNISFSKMKEVLMKNKGDVERLFNVGNAVVEESCELNLGKPKSWSSCTIKDLKDLEKNAIFADDVEFRKLTLKENIEKYILNTNSDIKDLTDVAESFEKEIMSKKV